MPAKRLQDLVGLATTGHRENEGFEHAFDGVPGKIHRSGGLTRPEKDARFFHSLVGAAIEEAGLLCAG